MTSPLLTRAPSLNGRERTIPITLELKVASSMASVMPLNQVVFSAAADAGNVRANNAASVASQARIFKEVKGVVMGSEVTYVIAGGVAFRFRIRCVVGNPLVVSGSSGRRPEHRESYWRD